MSGGGERIRCAIYTRKSTEEGLDQVFNTLDAQREACEAYIKSQAGEGWRALPEHYDDGGFSGGNMDRPAVRRLLADIDAGKVDVIVVYKVDRLTRSLMDFARIVERLEARGVSFVSVTQAFNTTTSMGRLTLNVLLSFAQFEREVTGERIRDKIAASKAKGIWMGGNIPLGYDLQDRKLVINPREAEQVRHIFTRYLALRSGVDLMRELAADGIVSKRCTSRSGKERGGRPFGCGALYYLLQNRIYCGEIVHRGVSHGGEHDPIVGNDLFEAVQKRLASNRRERGKRPARAMACPLAGVVFDAGGRLLTTSFSYGRGGKAYRYYVSPPHSPMKGASGNGRELRVPADGLETLVTQFVRQVLGKDSSWEELRMLVQRVEVRDRSIQLVISPGPLLEPHEPLTSAVDRLRRHRGEGRVELGTDGMLRLILDRGPKFRGGSTDSQCPESRIVGPDAKLVSRLKVGHQLLERFRMSPMNPNCHGFAEAPRDQRDRRLMHLGLIAPRLQKQMLEGRYLEAGHQFFSGEFPLAWADQLRLAQVQNPSHDNCAKMS
ncbi:recombinase family protein [Sphingomonas sp.]|jgi:DNA invertase Pin-like site-specific DNA recombinase|uniref:recombinase family protein n=1 Tax=Sphingomonas sp. TaxID=28214 RepID=UPI0017C93FB3|nr:recombinase family protein [Sphingomonas sp.]MBA3511593.1 recombinase family protein [Sphingomonas sp.]